MKSITSKMPHAKKAAKAMSKPNGKKNNDKNTMAQAFPQYSFGKASPKVKGKV